MSGPKYWWPDLIHRCFPLTRRRASSDPSPLSSPLDNNTMPTEVISDQVSLTPSIALLPASARAPQTAQFETSPAISALKAALGGLRDSLSELPPLQVAIGGLLECVVHLQIEEQNRQAYDELASDLASLAAILQKHVVESRPHAGPYSIANVERAIGEQAQLIKTQQERPRIGRLATAKEDEEAILKCYRRIGALFQQLQADILLSVWDDAKERDMDMRLKDLSPAYDAYHNAALPTSVTKRVKCTQDTRVDLLKAAQDWACDENGAKIYWLNGMAGTGKTTIAFTLCEILLAAKQLGASFFCSRNSPDCRNVNKIVPTIAYQLGRYSNPFRQALCDALRSDLDASKRNIGTQFEHLIVKPFAKMGRAMPRDVIVVIDALDECADVAGTKEVLNMLIRHRGNLPIKFFVASRPEPTISRSMAACGGASRSMLRLHDIEKSLVQADITLYLAEALESIHISPSETEQLAAQAGNLFIFAATAVRYILPETETVNNKKRLQEVLALHPNRKNRSHQEIDDLYSTILTNALDETRYNEEEVTMRRQVLWVAICAKEPLTMAALAEMLHVPDEEVRLAIQPLQSVLHVSELSSAVSALHASFPDFLLAEERSGGFYCDEVTQNSSLAECCFGLMSQSLKFNICGLESSYVLDNDIPDLHTRVNKEISTGLFYSCRYWGDHLTRCPPSPTLLPALDLFLQQHLLFWMEVLNLKGQIGHGDVVLSQVLTWLPTEEVSDWTELRTFTYDARNFLTSFAGNPTSLSTPHIYLSTLPFTSRQSRVRMTYWQHTRGLIEIEGPAMERRSESALATWEVGGYVYSIAQSSDGKRVVSGSSTGISIWDVSRGARILGPLRDHETVWSVAFSPDNSRIASSSHDGTICFWDAYNGDLVISPLHGHTSDVFSVAFSPDGTCLASGSADCTIRMWDAHTGAAIGDAFEGHREAVRSVAFSPDGEYLASGSEDCTIRVRNWRTGAIALGPIEGHGEPVRSIMYSSDGLRLVSGSSDSVRVWDMTSGALLAGSFEGHTSLVKSVSFSPNGIQVVSGSFDGTIRVWEAKSGKLLAGPFEGHYESIMAVLFTTDGTRILSGSLDGTIRVWDARHRTTGATESLGHSGWIWSVAVSPDGTHVASGSGDCTICVWDTHNGALVAGPFTGHTNTINSVAFSPDGARIVSGSWDNTLRTWDASTGALIAGPFEGHTYSVSSVAFSSNGSQIASGSGDYTIRLWDSHTGESVAEPFRGHTGTVTSVAFSPNGARIVSGSSEGTIQMWDASDGTALWTSDAHTGSVWCVAFSPNGTCVVSGSSDKTILVLNSADGAVLHGPFAGHTSSVKSVAFSPDGTRVISGSDDQTMYVWDVQSGAAVVGPLKGHTSYITSVAFSPDGARIISGSADHTIRFWDIAAATQPDATSFDGWSIDHDGWLVDSQSQRLFWVPSDLRDGFWLPTPSNPLVSNARCTTRVDDTTLLGGRWSGCYDVSRGLVPS